MFAPKVKAAASSTNSLGHQSSTLMAHRPGRHSMVEQALFLQRTIGNQATLPLLQQRASRTTEKEPGAHHGQKASQEDMMVRDIPCGVSWDFSKIPLFPPERADRLRSPSPFMAPPPPADIQTRLLVGQTACENEHKVRALQTKPDTALQAPAATEQMLRAQGSPPDVPGAAMPTSLAQAPATPEDQIAQADASRLSILQKARTSVRQLQIACQEQAEPTLMTQALPDQVRSFFDWLAGILPSDPSFCAKVALVLSDIDKNLNMALPSPYFPTPQEMADPNELCNLESNFVLAHYEDTQVRICPRLLTPEFTNVQRALSLVHELFHEPSFGMGHATRAVQDTSHCAGGSPEEAVNNPYCVTNVVGDLGAGQVF